MKKILLLLPLILYSCSSDLGERILNVKDEKGMDILASQLTNDVDKVWGLDELLVTSRKDYVKYTDYFLTRSHIGFDDGVVIVETQGDKDFLVQAITDTLLMGVDNLDLDVLNTDPPKHSPKPFLYQQVKDNNGNNILTLAQAEAYAKYLVRHKLQRRTLHNGASVQYVKFYMIANHLSLRAKKFMPLIISASEKYNISRTMILSIMEVESSFNPYSRSHANAIGLMQVVPSTAGHDVSKRIKNKDSKPSERFLFDPANNIDYGTGYLYILKNNYLLGIKNYKSLEFAMISSYNGGAGSVLRVFDSNMQEAINKINNMSAEKVYYILTNKHPAEETRNYLKKVTNAAKKYRVISK